MISLVLWLLLPSATSSDSRENEVFRSSFELVAQASKYVIERCAFYKINGKGLILKTTDITAFTVENCGFLQCRDMAISSESKSIALRLNCFQECAGNVHAVADESVELGNNFFLQTNGDACVYAEAKDVKMLSCNLSRGFARGAITVVSDRMDLEYVLSIGLSTSCWLSVQRAKGDEYFLQSSLVSAEEARMEALIETSPGLWINKCGFYTANNIVKTGKCTFIDCSFSGSEDDVKKACPNAELRGSRYNEGPGDFSTENPPRSDQCWALMPTETPPKSSNGLIVGGVVTLLVVAAIVALVIVKCLCGNSRAHKRPLLYM